MRARTILRLVVVASLTAVSASAQSTTATLVGRATAAGTPLAGVIVTVSSPSLMGGRTLVTAADGQYVAAALPPGDYVIRFEMEGLDPLAQRATLRLAQITRVDAELMPARLEAEIVVRPQAESLLETPQVSTSITGGTMELLPIGRGILDTVRLAPGVLQMGSQNLVSINGSEVYDNLYMVNGVTVGHRENNQPLNLFIEDAIQETTILTSGISSEYGRFTGGVVNVITKSGGNELSGSLRDTLGNDAWAARTPYENEVEHLDEVGHELQATLGGRVVRDRLWFFLSGRYYDRNFQRATRETVLPFVLNNYEDRSEAKLTASVSRNQSLVGSYLRVLSENENLNTPADLRALYTSHSPQSLLALHYTAVIGNNLVAEAQYSKKKQLSRSSGGGEEGPIGGLPIYDINSGAEVWASTTCAACGHTYGNAEDVLMKGSWFFPSARLGTHEVAFGYDDYHEYMRNTYTIGTSNMVLETPVAFVDGNAVVQLLPDETLFEWFFYPEGQEGDFNSRALYVNDRVSLGSHLTASAGVRYDRNHAVNSDGRVVGDDARLSPRVGLIYDLFGNGRDRVHASFSRYTSKPHESSASYVEQATSPSAYYWIYDGEPLNADPEQDAVPTEDVLRELLDWFEARGGTENIDDVAFMSPGGYFELGSTLDSPYSDEIALGYGRTFGQTGTAQITLVSREWSSFFTLGTDAAADPLEMPNGDVYDRRFLSTEDEGLKREYKSVQVQGSYQRGRLMAAGNYTYATLRGNVETGSGGGSPTPQFSPVSYFREFTTYPQNAPMGYLDGDVRHTANGWLILQLPGDRHRMTVSLLERFHTGRPYNMKSTINLRDVGPNPGYATNSFLGQYYFVPRGSLRMDDVTSTSVALHYSLQLARFELLAQGNVINVFNQQALENPAGVQSFVLTSLYDPNLARFNPFTTTPIECPAGVSTSSPQCKGITHYKKLEGFGEVTNPVAYQQPRTYTVSFAVRF